MFWEATLTSLGHYTQNLFTRCIKWFVISALQSNFSIFNCKQNKTKKMTRCAALLYIRLSRIKFLLFKGFLFSNWSHLYEMENIPSCKNKQENLFAEWFDSILFIGKKFFSLCQTELVIYFLIGRSIDSRYAYALNAARGGWTWRR